MAREHSGTPSGTAAPPPEADDESVRRLEQLIARVLRLGVWGSAALLVAGAALGPLVPVPGSALSAAGLLLLIATPVLRVAISIAVFARQGDRAFVLVTSGVLALLLTSFLLGLLGRAGG